ncbi:hypothetical protein DB32_004565 [Sandaracinus amylolyticus]|uniref:Uncharacterized protein n=1 Tax=Sandaracinus amylolyticus TaxID=927083 RepID=A0A0F6YJU1_9BACT|nr:hypothetical protein DB32_004565 [Sandaracinus amylolyticus]
MLDPEPPHPLCSPSHASFAGRVPLASCAFAPRERGRRWHPPCTHTPGSRQPRSRG